MKLVIYGAGAIGGSLGAYLVKAGHEVLFVDADPEHVREMNRGGLHIEGIDRFVVPVRAVLPDEIDAPIDAALLAVKSQATREAMEAIAERLSPESFVVSLQNGMNLYDIAEYVGRERVVGAFVNWAADYISPGRILLGGKSDFVVGEMDGSSRPRIARLLEMFRCFLPARETGDILSYLWSKQVNISVMFATGITPLTIDEGLSAPRYRDLLAQIAREAMQVPDRLGITLRSFDDFDPALYRAARYDDALRVTADHYRNFLKRNTGLYRDLAVRNRRSEIDGTVGKTVAIGENLGLSLPCNRKLTELVHEIESGTRAVRAENLDSLNEFFTRLPRESRLI